MKRCYGCFSSIKDELDVCPFCGYAEGTTPEESVHMNPGTILLSRYIIGKVIGYGGFGVTYIGWDAKLEQKVAIKEYLPSEFSTRMPGQSAVSVFGGVKNEQFVSGLNKFVDEAKRLSKFQNEDGIVTIFDCIAENNTAYIIMEYLEGETLAEKLKREKTIPEKEAISIMLPVMESLKAVHKEGIIHRDISPDNIFLTNDGKVKLIDFGAARFATTSYSRSLTVIIKPGYSAEEQYRSRSDQGPYTDVYSIAATLYKMITGETPPDALERRAKIENAKKDILIEPHKLNRNITLTTENALLNALNIQIDDRTQSIEKFIEDIESDTPVKREYGKIKKIDFYRIPLWLKVFAPSILVVILTFGALLAFGAIKFDTLFKTNVDIPEGYTIVPSLEGLTIEEATTQLKLSNLNYSTGGNVTSEYIEANLIVFQDPESGRIIPINSLVSLTVSRGNGDVTQAVNGIATVPIFVWSEESIAVSDFTKAGLETTVEYIYDENVSAGQVIRATDVNGNTIEAGMQIAEGSMVILFISKGSEGFPMPNVIGFTENDAKTTLETAGLIVAIIHVQNATAVKGTVFEQSIAADTKVTLGTQVEISVASDEDEIDSSNDLQSVSTVPTSAWVVDTVAPTPTPTPITTSDVSITESETTTTTEEPKTIVPDVVGLDEDSAMEMLFDAGYVNFVVYYRADLDAELGTVIDQYPVAGEEYSSVNNWITLFICDRRYYDLSVSEDRTSAYYYFSEGDGYEKADFVYENSEGYYPGIEVNCFLGASDGMVDFTISGLSDLPDGISIQFNTFNPQTGLFNPPDWWFGEYVGDDYCGSFDAYYGPNCVEIEIFEYNGTGSSLIGSCYSNVVYSE